MRERGTIERLLCDMAHTGAVYILGAGASAGQAPLGSQLPEAMLQVLRDHVSGMCGSRNNDTPLLVGLGLGRDAIARKTREDYWDGTWGWWALRNQPHEVHCTLYDWAFVDIEPVPECPPQYRVFWLLPPYSATVVTLNHDGLLPHYLCGRLECVEVHGSPRKMRIPNREEPMTLSRHTRRELLKQNLEWADIGAYLLPPLIVRPGDPELDCLWRRASFPLGSTSTLIIIGCSFQPYDEAFRARLKCLLGERQVKIHVLDRNAAHIAGELSEYLHRHVTPWVIDWCDFSTAMVKVAEHECVLLLSRLAQHHRKIMGIYNRLQGF